MVERRDEVEDEQQHQGRTAAAGRGEETVSRPEYERSEASLEGQLDQLEVIWEYPLNARVRLAPGRSTDTK